MKKHCLCGLKLSGKPYYALLSSGRCNTIEELINHTYKDLMHYRRFGKKGLAEVVHELDKVGLCLKKELAQEHGLVWICPCCRRPLDKPIDI